MKNITNVLMTCLAATLSAQTASAATISHQAAAPVGELIVSMQNVGAGDTSVALGATRVPLLSVTLSASCEADVRVSEIELHHTGLGSASDLEGVYFSDDVRRLSRVTSFDGDGNARVRLTDMLIPKCGVQRMTAMVNISKNASAGGEHGLVIERATALQTTAKTVRLEVSQQPMTVKATPKQSSTISVNFLSVPGRLRYGRVETVARLQLSADAKSDHLLKSITLTNQETARDMQLIRFFIESSKGGQISLVAHRMQAKKVTLIFEPSFVLRRSRTVVLNVKAEVRVSNGAKVRFTLEEPSDLEAKEYRAR